MALSGNDAFFYSSINNSSSVTASVVDFSTLGLTTNKVIGYLEPYLTTTITTDGLTEGKSNIYYTDARSRAAISTSGAGLNYSTSTGVISNTGVTSLTGTANRVTVSTSTGAITLSGPQDLGTSSSPQFAGLTLTSLTGVLKATAGVISGSATTDDLPEGKSNLYYLDARSRAAISASTGISYSSSTGVISNSGVVSLTGTANRVTVSASSGAITLSGPQDLGVSSSPQFARLLNSSLLTNNMLLGTSAGSALTTGTDNILIGSTTATSLTTGTYNICIGDLAGQGSFPLASGLRNVYIGAGAYPSAASPTREIVIGGIAGNGNNTCTIAALNGLYVSNLGTGILRATAGMINLAATADFVASLTGTANRVTVSASTGAITISGPQDIGTSSSPQFARLLNSSIGSTNLLLGTSTGANLTTGGGNTLIGQGSGACITSGTYNIGLGPGTYGGSGNMNTNNSQNIAVGVNALFSCATSASQNIALGSNALINMTTGNNNIQLGNGATNTLTTGSNNVYIGQAIIPSAVSVSNEGILNLTNSSITGKGANTMFIQATAGLYYYIPYSINLWNNNAATVSQVEQWTLLNTANSGIANIGTTPTITSGVITNIPVGVYSFNITGSLYGFNTTFYPTLQYKASGGSFVRVALAMPSFPAAWTCPIAINANIRISDVNDAIRLWYDTGTPYANVGTIPPIYSPAGNYLPRHMTITFISL